MKYIIAIIVLILLTGCGKPIILLRATLFNSTDHNIQILFYKGGVVEPNDTVSLSPNSQFLLGNSYERHVGIGRGFFSDYFGGSDDSMIVVFDGQYQITHYGNTPLSLAKHYYLATSIRNLGNPYSYIFSVMHDDGTVNDHKYYFTEQDYLDAKD